MKLKLQWICDIIGHIWIQIQLKDHNVTFENFINGKKCKRCGIEVWY